MIALAIALQVRATQPNLGYRLDGKHLLASCDSKDAVEVGMCAGYVSGVIDQSIIENEITGGRSLICVPQQVSALDLMNVVTAAIRADHEHLDGLPASVAASKALFALYPCSPVSSSR